MGKSILEEAVDDVQALKKAAEENAKNLLVEAMSPRIKDFIQSHLGQEGVDAAIALEGQEGQNDLGQSHVPQYDQSVAEDDSVYEIDDVDIDDEDDDEDVDVKHNCDDDEDEDDDDSDVNVDIVKKEASEMDDEDKKVDESDETVEMTAEDLKRAFQEVLQAGLKEDSGAKFGDAQDPNDGEYGLVHKVKGEVQWADGAKVIQKAKNAKMVTKEHNKQVHQLLRQNAQYAEALQLMKKSLNEMHLFNSKLLYTTKLLQTNLSNKQKMNVVESIDKAKTQSEVKLVFNALSESLKIAGVLGESKNSVKGPRASRFAKPSSTLNEAKTQESSQSNRWAELAGLIEN